MTDDKNQPPYDQTPGQNTTGGPAVDPDKPTVISSHPASLPPQGTMDDNDRTVISYPAEGAGVSQQPHSMPPQQSYGHPHSQQPMPMQPSLEPLQALDEGTVINDMYRVGTPIGQGGMGRVFRGEEVGTGEAVAIKVILPEVAADQKIADLFRSEARVLRSLHHDAIVRYFAYVPPSERLNVHALIMGFIEGTKLSDSLRHTGPLNLQQACKLFIRLADGLGAAHDTGLVHRDLSPDNVMLRDDRIDEAVLIDFGIAKSGTVSDVTLGGEFAGKLKYVSPEQLGAFGGQADQRSDIYSMGLLMIIVTTGHAAPMGTTIVEAVRARDTIPDLSAVPAELQGLVYQMLQPNPDHRPPDMKTVKAALENILKGIDPSAMLTTSGPTGGITGTPSMPAFTSGPMPMTQRPVQGLQSSPVSPTGMPMTHAPYQSMPPGGAASSEPEKKGGRGLLIFVSLLVILGAGGFVAWTQKDKIPFLAEQEPAAPEPARTPAEFLARSIPQGCIYATRRGTGVNSGMIEVLRSPDTEMGNWADEYATKFNATPTIVDRGIAPGQCATLELARRYQDTSADAIEFGLDVLSLEGRDPFSGKIDDLADRRLSLFLISPNGQTYSANPQVTRVDSNSAIVRGGLSRFPAGSYVFVAIASEDELAHGRNFDSGISAYDLFRKIDGELEKQDNVAVGVTVLEKK